MTHVLNPSENNEHDHSEWKSCYVVNPTDSEVRLLDSQLHEQFAAEAEPESSPPVPDDPANHVPLTEVEQQAMQNLSPQQRRALNNELHKAHRGLGHPNRDRFYRILKLGGANNAVLGLAKQFTCSQCQEDARPKPWRRAAPPRELTFNELVGIDTFTLKHHDTTIKCLNVVCWGTRYQMVIPLSSNTAASVRAAYRTWIKLFGPPRIIKPDMGKEFLRDFMYRCSTDGTEVDMSSLESPTQNSITEREGGSFKTMFSKTSLDYGPTDSAEEIFEMIDVVAMMKNRLNHRGGYSAMQRVFGYTPTMPGDVMFNKEQENNLMHHSMIELGDITLQKQARMRECAGKAFFSHECASALRRAVASGPRRTTSLEVGQLVFFWSSGQFNKVANHHSAARKPNHQFWNGPCRVVAVQYPTSIYLSYQGRLVKAAPEQCRLASQDEDASCSEIVKKLCSLRESLHHDRINGLSDIRGEPRPTCADDASFHPTGRKRHTTKAAPVPPPKVMRTDPIEVKTESEDNYSPCTPGEDMSVAEETEAFDG